MNKKIIIIGVALLIILIAAVVFFYITAFGSKTASLAHVDDLHMQMSASSLGELEAIIQNNNQPYTRERAVMVYSDIASRSGNGDRALAFLKNLAINEEDDNVRKSVYAHYYWLKDQGGIQPESSVDVKVTGDIKSGSTITILLGVTSTRGSNLSEVWMQARQLQGEPAISDNITTVTDANTGKGALTNVRLTPSNLVRKPLPANITVEFPYTVEIRGPGKVMLEISVKVPYDNRLDYDAITKEIILDVGSNSGTYTISE